LKKSKLLLGLSFLLIFLFSFNLESVVASDDDDDGVDDEFEDLNRRIIQIEVQDYQAEIESVLKEGNTLNALHFKILPIEEGLVVEFQFMEDNESFGEINLEFVITFQEIVEYIDNNSNGIYDEISDDLIQSYMLTEFWPINYSVLSISDVDLHYLEVQTKDGVFKAHFYVAEEFVYENNSLITPNQVKINIEINNFGYSNNNSQLALYIKLESELDFEREEETEDENKGFAINEQGLITAINQFTGFFTWQENATIDGINQQVQSTSITTDDLDEDEQKMYINYQRGINIFHDPKIGVEGLWRSKILPFPIITLVIIIVVISAISVSVAYTVYHYSHNGSITPILKDKGDDYRSFDNRKDLVVQIFEDEDPIEKLIELKDINITAISEDFVDIINKFEWESNEKEEFIAELLSLNPAERKKILNKMLKKR